MAIGSVPSPGSPSAAHRAQEGRVDVVRSEIATFTLP
jgi:hypothetical protein